VSWDDKPPRGHPMEPGQFPGPLYPPSAAPGHTPSKDSDFAVAVKRATAKLGAFPWDPDGWDDTYNEKIAAAVSDVQRWSGTLEPTGWVGEKTFNFYRSALVPQGRTHAGLPCWDSVCVNLTAAAYEQAHPPAASSTARETALRIAVDELEQRENPAGSNMQPYGAWYGENGVPWCAIFATWAYEHAAIALGFAGGHPSFQTVKQAGSADRYDYVPYVVADARGGRYGLTVTSTPMPGDLVCFDWERNGEYDHIGLFEKWDDRDPKLFWAIEGNTSTSDNSNGGQVMRRTRDLTAQGTVFVRVREP